MLLSAIDLVREIGGLCFFAVLVFSCFSCAIFSAMFSYAVAITAREKRDEVFTGILGRERLCNDEVHQLVAARSKSRKCFLHLLNRLELERDIIEKISRFRYPASWSQMLAVITDYYLISYGLAFLHMFVAGLMMVCTITGNGSLTPAAVATYVSTYLSILLVINAAASLAARRHAPLKDDLNTHNELNSQSRYTVVEW
jgi:hypothetical protein